MNHVLRLYLMLHLISGELKHYINKFVIMNIDQPRKVDSTSFIFVWSVYIVLKFLIIIKKNCLCFPELEKLSLTFYKISSIFFNRAGELVAIQRYALG